ncbi:MAG: hypothetical protein EA382_09835 [Spirochaetaceae bacterium]|nr:MAG: hypothetical protein EA382_09835 [Spirochaetaceae bacterium]
MRQFWGTACGALIGLLGGVWGAAFGAFIGLLADLVFCDLRVQRESLRFLATGERPGWLPPALPVAGAVAGALAARVRGALPADASDVESIESALAEFRVDRYASRLCERMIAAGARSEVDEQAIVDRARSSLTESEREHVMTAVWNSYGADVPVVVRDRARRLARALGLNDAYINDTLSVHRVLDATACEVLGVARDATREQVRDAYRALVTQFHPDTATHLSQAQQREATEAFVRIHAAYEVLRSQLDA